MVWRHVKTFLNSPLMDNFVSRNWKSILRLSNLWIFSRISQKERLQRPPKIRRICMRKTTHCFPSLPSPFIPIILSVWRTRAREKVAVKVRLLMLLLSFPHFRCWLFVLARRVTTQTMYYMRRFRWRTDYFKERLKANGLPCLKTIVEV